MKYDPERGSSEESDLVVSEKQRGNLEKDVRYMLRMKEMDTEISRRRKEGLECVL